MPIKTTYSTFTIEPNHDFIDDELSDISLNDSLDTVGESLMLTAEEIVLSLGLSLSDSNESLDIVYSILCRHVDQSYSNLSTHHGDLSHSWLGVVPAVMANKNEQSPDTELNSQFEHN